MKQYTAQEQAEAKMLLPPPDRLVAEMEALGWTFIGTTEDDGTILFVAKAGTCEPRTVTS